MKKLLKYGVASLSLATLGVVTTATDLPVLGAHVVHAEDAVEPHKVYLYRVYISRDGGSSFSPSGHGNHKTPPKAEDFYGSFPYPLMVTDVEVKYEGTYSDGMDLYSVYLTIKDLSLEEGGGNIQTPPADSGGSDVADGNVDPKNPAADPVSDNNADTGGGNNVGGDTGYQDQTPPTDNNTGGDTQTPPADAPKPQTLTVVETRQDENGEVIFTKTHSLVLNPGEEKDLGYNPDREVLVRGGNLYRYGNFEEGVTLYFTTRNQLLAQVDQSRLTDEQKGELAVKIAFAETAEELDKLKAELTSLTAPANKPAPASAAKPAIADNPAPSAAKTLPATGELTTQDLTAMGLSLVLFSLGLAKARKTK